MWKDAELDYPNQWDDDYGCWLRSKDVLIYAKGIIYLGYRQLWADNEEELDYGPDWRESGRNSYRIEGVTHWADLPNPPQYKYTVRGYVPIDTAK